MNISPLGKAFAQQRKTIEYQEKDQIKAIQNNEKQWHNNDLLL